ncbi:MAG TPA: VTT domain-containing protein [Bdellovibrionota bacterium]|nr:VTT domain-containing protein [Bdellovibrionota bacterium]
MIDLIVSAVTSAVSFVFQLLDPNQLEALLLSWGWLGYPILFGIVFAETGLLAGFFFPGDSLLFIAGFVSSRGILNILWLNVLLMVAAIVGDGVGYYLGRKSGPRIFRREESVFFKKSHLIRTQEFYHRHGGKTVVLARFMPIIRTFAPFVAGMATMSYPRFLSYNVFGGVGWVLLMTLSGFWLGNIPVVRRNFELVVVLIVAISFLPVLWHGLRRGKAHAKGS